MFQRLETDPIFHEIGDVADELGLDCHLVGGYVRDLFLDRPSKDIDCVVVGSGIDVAEALARRKGAKVTVFKNFGTAQVSFEGGTVEFVGARRESYQRGSRKPIVEDGTLEDDLNRRDFTINALAIRLNRSGFGELTDRFGGIGDMKKKILTTPLDPDITFQDDPLRMMRCIRFASQLKFQIEDETFDSLCRNIERIRIISKERIVEELNKIIMSPRPSIGFVELERSGLLKEIFPEMSALVGSEVRNGRSHKDNFYHTLEVLDNVASTSDSLFLRWSALLHDIGKPASKRFDSVEGWTFHNHNYIGKRMVSEIFHNLKLPCDQRMKYVEKLVELHMRPIVMAKEEITDSALRRLLFEAGPDIEDLMILCEADVTSKNDERKKAAYENLCLVRSKLKDLQARDDYRTWKNPITGNEIMEALGIGPCNEIGILKQAVKDAIWEGTLENNHNAAFEYMMKKAKELGL